PHAALWGLRIEECGRRYRALVPDLDRRSARHPPSPVSRRSLRPRGVSARSAEPRERAIMRKAGALVGLVSRVPARVQVKLLAAFLAIAALLIVMGAVGLQVLSRVNQRTDELIRLQRKIEAYRQVQHTTASQLYSASSVLLSPNDMTLASTLRQLNQLGYNVDRLQFVARDEVELLDRFRQEYERFTDVVTQVVEFMGSGRAAEA